VPAEGNGDLQTLICVLVARPRRCLTLLNPVPWQNWMAPYLGYTLRMRTLFRGWPIMVNDTHNAYEKKKNSQIIILTPHMLVWQGTKFAVFSLSGYWYLSNGGTNRCDISHDGRYGSRTSLPFWGWCPQGIPQIRNFGPKFWPFDRKYLKKR